MIGIAIIGYGYWGPNLARNFAETEGASLAMVCDADPRRLALAQKRFPALSCAADFDEALRNPDVNAVAIATPVHTHYELAKRAIKAGKHVLVEKPLTARVDQAEELVALAEKNGVVLMVDHVFVYSPPVLKMKEMVAQGRLGKLFFIDSVRINLGLFQRDVNVVWDLAPHDLSIVDFLVDRLPVSLSAYGTTHANHDIEDVAYLNLDYGDGLIANFHVNWLSPVKVRQMIIGGSERSLIYNDLHVDEKIKVYDRGIDVGEDPEQRHKAMISYRSGDVWSPNLATREPLSQMAEHFISCIKSGQQPVSNGKTGVRIVKILDAAQRSIKSQNGRVNIN
jgi:predicted dehydrogenase